MARKKAPPPEWRITDAPPEDVHMHLQFEWRKAVSRLQEDLTDAGARPERWHAAVLIYEAVYGRRRGRCGPSAARGAAIEKLLQVLGSRTTPAQLALLGVPGIAVAAGGNDRVARWRATANSHKYLLRSLEDLLLLITAIRAALLRPGIYYGGSAAVGRAPHCPKNPAKAAKKPKDKPPRKERVDKTPVKSVADTMQRVYSVNVKLPREQRLSQEKALEQVAAELGISLWTVRRALKEAKTLFPGQYSYQKGRYQRDL